MIRARGGLSLGDDSVDRGEATHPTGYPAYGLVLSPVADDAVVTAGRTS